MFSDTATWRRNGARPRMHLDAVDPPSLQQNGGRKGLLARLRSVTPPQDGRQPDDTPREPQYVDVTAAFFGRHRRQAPRVKNSAPSHHAHHPLPRPQGFLSLGRPLQQQRPQSPPEEPQTPDLSLASALRSELDHNIAVEGSNIYSNGCTRLNNLYEALKGAVAETGAENDRVLALLDSQHKRIDKPLSETRVAEISTDKHGKETVYHDIHIGRQVTSVREQIQDLEAEVGQLWAAWEAADQEVRTILASMAGGPDDRSGGQADSIKGVQDSLAREMKKFDEECESILKETHGEVRASEKEFGKKINGVMSALLQQYLLGD